MCINRSTICISIAVSLMASPAMAEDLFPLLQAVPQDVFYVRAGRRNPKHTKIDKAWQGFFKAVMESGVVEETLKLVSPAKPSTRKASEDDGEEEESPEAAEFARVLGQVDWGELVGREWVFTARLRTQVPEAVALMRVPRKNAANCHASLKAVLEKIKERSTLKMKTAELKTSGASLTALVVGKGEYSMFVGDREDVVIVSFGDVLVSESLELLAGESKKKGLVETQRFKKAFEKLPAAEDGLSFFDRVNLAKAGEKLLADEEKKSPPVASAPQWTGLIRSLVKDLQIIEYEASTTRTEGLRAFTDAWSPLVRDAKSRAGYAFLVRDQSCEPFDKFVPNDSLNFAVSSGTDWPAAYKWLRATLKDRAPDGNALLRKLDDAFESVDLNLERDVFSWFEGTIINMTVSNPDPRITQEPVILLKVNDEEKAMEKIKSAIIAVGKKANLGQVGPLFSLSPITIAGHKNFYGIDIRNPMLGMMLGIAPVMGIHDGFLIITGTKYGAERILGVAAGDFDSIRKDEQRFLKEGLLPRKQGGRLIAIDYTDSTKTADAMQSMLRGWSMIGLVTRSSKELKPYAPTLAKIGDIAGRLSPAMASLDFFQSEASCTTFDGKGWYERRVINYREIVTAYEKEPGEKASEGPGGAEEAKKNNKDKL